MPYQLFQWKSPIPFPKQLPAIAQEFIWGEEVEGLIDLPIKEMLDALKVEFPKHHELPGSLMIDAELASIEVTWSWQYLRYQASSISPADEQKLRSVGDKFECTQFEPK